MYCFCLLLYFISLPLSSCLYIALALSEARMGHLRVGAWEAVGGGWWVWQEEGSRNKKDDCFAGHVRGKAENVNNYDVMEVKEIKRKYRISILGYCFSFFLLKYWFSYYFTPIMYWLTIKMSVSVRHVFSKSSNVHRSPSLSIRVCHSPWSS